MGRSKQIKKVFLHVAQEPQEDRSEVPKGKGSAIWEGTLEMMGSDSFLDPASMHEVQPASVYQSILYSHICISGPSASAQA